MNWLQPHFYIPFPAQIADYQLMLVDLLELKRLLVNVQFTRRLKETAPLSRGDEFFQIFRVMGEFAHKKNTTLPLEVDLLNELHLISDPEARPILEENAPRPVALTLLSERFFWKWPVVNLGSARHGLLWDYQIKGMGRNPLAIRVDYYHSWGGQYLWQGLKAYVLGHLMQGLAPLGVLKTSMVSVAASGLKNWPLSSSSLCLTLRESTATRVTQITTGFDPEARPTQAEVLGDFLKRVGARSPDEHLQKVIFHYASLLLMGVRHGAITRENVTLEGALIDYEDIKFDAHDESYEFYIMFRACQGKHLGVPYHKGEKLFTSAIHFYLDAIELTAIGLASLTGRRYSLKSLKQKFWKMLKQLEREVFIIEPSLMEFMQLVLEHEAIYNKGDTLEREKISVASKLVKAVEKKSPMVEMTEDLGTHTTRHLIVNFARPRLRHEFVDEQNKCRFNSVANITNQLLRRLTLETRDTHFGTSEALEFSSACNRVIAEHALCYPYAFERGKIRLKARTRAQLMQELHQKLEGLALQTIKLDEQKESEKSLSLVRGFTIEFKGKLHYVCLPAQLIKK